MSDFYDDVKVVISNLSELLLAYSSIGFSKIGFDDEMLRKEFFKGIITKH